MSKPIIKMPKSRMVECGDLGVGETFTLKADSNRIFMNLPQVIESGNLCNVICLNDGELDWIENYKEVIPVKATIEVAYE